MANAATNVQPGDVLCGKYRIDEVLGEGGMGVVFSAWHLKLEQRVAVKVLRSEMLLHPEIVERFLREARAAAQIEGEHVARVMDVDALADGAPFMVMEHLDGADLARVLAERSPFPPELAVGYVLEACEAIAEAHALGIVHRDLKPANLFLARRRDGTSRIKVLDFGISKLTGPPGAENAGMTRTSVVLGSIEYMSPEQMRSARDVDARADIWALGVVLYELCTGEPPFPGESLTAVCAKVTSDEPRPPRTLRPELPPRLEAVILRCLAKDRDARFPSVGDLQAALAPFAQANAAQPEAPRAALVTAPTLASPGSRPAIARTPRMGPSPVTDAGVATPRRDEAPPRSSGAFAIAGAAVLVLGLGIGVGVTASRGRDGAPPQQPAPAASATPTPPQEPAHAAPVEPPPPVVVAASGGAPAWAWAVGGTGAALLIAGTGLGIDGLITFATLKDKCSATLDHCPPKAIYDPTSDNTRKDRDLALFIGLGGAGAIAVATAVAVLVRAPPSRRTGASALRVVPAVSPSGAGAVVSMSFW